MNNQEIGENAGLIWNTLETKGEMQISKLKKTTELSVEDFYLALGWLARENKISLFENKLQKWICLIY